MSHTNRPLRVALIGTAARSAYLYGPILHALPHEVELVSVWGRSEQSARRLGETVAAPWFTDRLSDLSSKDAAMEQYIAVVAKHAK